MKGSSFVTKIVPWVLFLLISIVDSFSILAQETIESGKLNQMYLQGLRLIGAQKYDEAIEQFKEIIDQAPSFSRAYAKLVALYEEKNELDNARQYFEELIAKNPHNPYAYYGVGQVWKEKKNLHLAIENYRKSIHLFPECAVVFRELVDAYKGLKNLNEAVEFINGIIKTNPNNAAARYGLGYVYELQNQWGKGLESLNKAIELNPNLLIAYYSKGKIQRYTGRFQDCLRINRVGLDLAERNHDLEYKRLFLGNIGIVYRNLGKSRKALEYLEQALKIDREIGDRRGEAIRLGNIGNIYRDLGDHPKALTYFKRALGISEEIEDIEDQGIHLSNIGIVYRKLDNLHKALEYYKRALKIARQVGNKRSEGIRLGNIGIVYKRLGDFPRALVYYEQALKIAREIEDRSGEKRHLGNIGVIYRNLGDYAKALEYHKQALEIARELGAKRSQARHLGNIGIVYYELGNYPKALKYFEQSLMIARETEDKEGAGICLGNIGLVLTDSGDFAKAFEFYEQALKIDREIGNRKSQGFVLNGLGNVSFKLGDYSRSVEYYKKALAIGQEIRSPAEVWEAHAGLAAAYEEQGKYEKSFSHYRQAVEEIENVRSLLPTEEFKAGFLESKMEVYEKVIHLLANLHKQQSLKNYDKEAFHYAERARARAFLDILAEARADVRSGIEPEFKQRERSILRKLSRIQTQLRNPNLSAQDWRKLTSGLKRLEDEHEALKREIRRKNPRYANLIYPRPYRLSQVQKQVLDENAALLEFSLGKERSFVWLITKEHSSLHSLPGQDDIERKVEQHLQTISKPVGLTNPFSRHYFLGYELYTMLLGPVIGELEGKSHLIIVPDGILHYLPFETLITQKVNQDEGVNYLLKDYQISYAPSASVLGYLQDEGKKVRRKRLQLLAFGDPSFGRISEMAAARGEENMAVEMELNAEETANRGLYERRGFTFRRLPFSGTEVMEIADLFPPSEKTVYLGERAKEEVVKSEALERFKYIHFATHGIIEQKVPSRSGIVLTLDEDPTEDGFLQVNEIFNLKLDADVVVLSACQTGLGRLRKGEGIIGLARAFMYAGTPSVVVSLWNINDRSTASLMKNFYACLKKGSNKTEALQLAKLQMLQSERKLYRHPFYWAAFVLIGDYK